MRSLKKILSICLATSIIGSNVIVTEAATVVPGKCNVNYSMDDNGTVIESTTWDNVNTSVSRYVNPDGTGEIVVVENSEEIRVSFKNADYELYVSWIEENPVAEEITISHEENDTRGSDLVGSQYKHRMLATNKASFDRTGLKALDTFAKTYAALAVEMVNVPSMVISGFTLFFSNQMSKNTPERCNVSTVSYEVFFSADNVYYTHCYHMNINTINPNKSYKDYAQAVGGM